MTNPATQPASTPPKTMIGNMPAFMRLPPSLPCSSPTSRPLIALRVAHSKTVNHVPRPGGHHLERHVVLVSADLTSSHRPPPVSSGTRARPRWLNSQGPILPRPCPVAADTVRAG